MHEIYVTPKVATKDQLVAELNALAIPGVRTYSIIGGDEATGVYAWDAAAPAGEYQHIDLSDADQKRIADAVAAHTPAPLVDPDAELNLAFEEARYVIAAATTIVGVKSALVKLIDGLQGKARKGKVAGKNV